MSVVCTVVVCCAWGARSGICVARACLCVRGRRGSHNIPVVWYRVWCAPLVWFAKCLRSGNADLRHLRRAIWVIVMEQGALYPLCTVLWNGAGSSHHFCPSCLARLTYFLHPNLKRIDAVLTPPQLIPLPLRRAGGIPRAQCLQSVGLCDAHTSCGLHGACGITSLFFCVPALGVCSSPSEGPQPRAHMDMGPELPPPPPPLEQARPWSQKSRQNSGSTPNPR